jgi:two-component system LytT family response regulator
VFVTASAEHSLQAIKLDASGYILKPIDDEELMFAVNKALEDAKRRQAAALAPIEKRRGTVNKIGIPGSKGVTYVDIDTILYLESTKGATRVVCANESITSSYNLGAFAKLLEPREFFQIHRSFILNLRHVCGYNSHGTVRITNGDELPVSREVRGEFIKLFARVGKGGEE